jgi:hypothetical protein
MPPAFGYCALGAIPQPCTYQKHMIQNSKLTERITRSNEALKEAVDRFQGFRTSPSPADSFAVIKEALSWITTLDNDLFKLAGDKYREARDTHHFGKGVCGHRLLRDLIEHNQRAVDLVEVARGIQFPVRPPVCPWEFRWKERNALPDPDQHNAKYIGSYEQTVAGRLTRETLFEVATFFSWVNTNAELF